MIAFFIRGYNDIDHLVPVAWRMHREGHEVRVLSLSVDLDLEGDYRLRFLRAQGVSVDHAYADPELLTGSARRFGWAFVCKCFVLARFTTRCGLHWLARGLEGLGRRAFRLVSRGSLGPLDFDRFLAERKFQVLCFDWVPLEHSIVSGLLAAAHRAHVSTVALPHGVFLCTNDDIAWDADPAKTIGWRNALAAPFDRVVLTDPGFARHLKDGQAGTAKAMVLGSARYSEEWVSKNIEIAPRALPPSAYADPRLKVAFMLTRLQYKVDGNLLRKTFHRLASTPDVWVLVKPHTRGSPETGLYADLPLNDGAHLSTVELCQWADVVLVIASSVMVEALQQDKAVLCLDYLHSNTTLHDEYGDCWVIRSEKELAVALARLSEDCADVPYSKRDVGRFLTDIADGGIPNRDTLGDYSRMIAGLAGPL